MSSIVSSFIVRSIACTFAGIALSLDILETSVQVLSVGKASQRSINASHESQMRRKLLEASIDIYTVCDLVKHLCGGNHLS
jgi:hypothetical protein